MKTIVILGDGMADRPCPELGGKTPLQAARKPYIDRLARTGRCGMLDTIPKGFAPGSEIANLAVMGYDVPSVFEGRGSLEAASMGVAVGDGEMVMRCNLITIEEGRIKNHSGGHISTAEAHELIDFLQKELGGNGVDFYGGVSYRHLLKIRGGDKRIICTPPHDVPGALFADKLVRAAVPEAEETAELINRLILRSQELLADHPVNRRRRAAGLDPANSIWPWSPGYRPRMSAMTEKYGIRSGSVISAVDLIKGIGILAGLRSIDVEGATGLYDTNYEGKAQAAIEALRNEDFVYLHIEASDEAGHAGDAELKTRTIEYLDDRVVRHIVEQTSGWNEPVTIALLPDHPTPCSVRTHTADPVPFIINAPDLTPDKVMTYDEFAAAEGLYGTIPSSRFMDILMRRDER